MEADIMELREIVGDTLTQDDLNNLAKSNPNILVTLMWKLFDLLRFLARVPIERDSNTGEQRTMNLYRRVLDSILEKARGPNGEVPVWL